MENITAVGIDLSKRVFHLHGVNYIGRKVYAKKVLRKDFLKEVGKLRRGKVYIEAGAASHYWGESLRS